MVDTMVEKPLLLFCFSIHLTILTTGTCKQCQRGFNQACVNEQINGVTRDGGCTFCRSNQTSGMLTLPSDAEYCILQSEAAVHIPKDVDAASYAPLLCAGVTVFNSMRQMHIMSGETVAIQGLGGLGHLALQYANKMGYKVVALSSSSSKEKFAKDLGAHVYVDASKENHAEALTKLGGAAMIVSTAPNPEAMGDLVNGLAPGGKLILLSRKLHLVRSTRSDTDLDSGGWDSNQQRGHDSKGCFDPRLAFWSSTRLRRSYRLCGASQHQVHD